MCKRKLEQGVNVQGNGETRDTWRSKAKEWTGARNVAKGYARQAENRPLQWLETRKCKEIRHSLDKV